MSYGGQELIIRSALAGADLSADSNRFRLVKKNSEGKIVLCNAITDLPCGVLQNLPKSNELAEFGIWGPTHISADAVITVNSLISTSADGQAVSATPGTDTTVYIVGRMEEAAAAANDWVGAWVDCIAPARGA